MPGFQRYTAFVKAHREANPEIKNKEVQIRAAQALWKDVKNDPEKQQQMIFEFRTKTANRERKLMSYWNKALKTVPAKGQLISKGLFFFSIPQKRTKNFCPNMLEQKLTCSNSFFLEN